MKPLTRKDEPTGFRVMVRRCDQCLFSKNKIVGDDRKEEVLDQAWRKGGFFQCHKASIGDLKGGCCKGYFDESEDGVVIAVKRLGIPIQWIDPDSLMEVERE